MSEPTTIMGVKAALFVSAGTGGMVAALPQRGPWWLRLLSGCTGVAASYFWTPVVAPIAEIAMEAGVERFFGVTVDLDPPSVFGAVGFLIGVAGVELVQLTVDLVRGRRKVSEFRGGP
jgi:hypothetical protein